jgi:hypothetical protein
MATRAKRLAPWNTVFAASSRWRSSTGTWLRDVSFAIWHVGPLYGDPTTDLFGMAEFEPRARRTCCSATPTAWRTAVSWVDKILERQRAGRRAIKQASDAGDPAYQRLWDMAPGRASSARSAMCSHTAPPARRPHLKARPGG